MGDGVVQICVSLTFSCSPMLHIDSMHPKFCTQPDTCILYMHTNFGKHGMRSADAKNSGLSIVCCFKYTCIVIGLAELAGKNTENSTVGVFSYSDSDFTTKTYCFPGGQITEHPWFSTYRCCSTVGNSTLQTRFTVGKLFSSLRRTVLTCSMYLQRTN